jgi:Protein of unknown function (DUF1622)
MCIETLPAPAIQQAARSGTQNNKVGLIVKAAGRRNAPFSRSWNDFARLWSLSGLRLTPPGVGHGHWSNHRNDPFSLEKPGRCLDLSCLSSRLGTSNPAGARVLVAGDIIRTVVVHPTLDNLIVLAIIVVIRTFLSITLQLEVEGHWPWQHHDISGTKVARIKNRKVAAVCNRVPELGSAVRTPPVQPSDLSFRWIALSLKLRGEFLGLPWIDAAQAKLPTAMNLCKAVDR